jgi:hypothetical protein
MTRGLCRGCWGERRKGDWQACGKQSREEKCTLVVEVGKRLKDAGHMENLGVDRRIILEPILNV